MSRKVIAAILSLRDEMSAPLKQVSKTVAAAREKIKEAEAQVNGYREAAVKQTQAIAESRAKLTEMRRTQAQTNEAIRIAKQTIEQYTSATGLNGKQLKENNLKIKETREKIKALEEAYTQNAAAIKTAKGAVDQQKVTLEATNQKIKEAQEKVRKYGAEISKNNAILKESQKKLKEWGKSAVESIDKAIVKVAKWGSAIATATGALALKVGFSEGMDMEGYKTQLETAVKDTQLAGKLMSDAVKFANDTPFETGSIVQATAQMEALGISSKKWLAVAADMAGGTSRGIEEASEATIKAVNRGDFQDLEKFGLNRQILMLEAEKKYGKNIVFNKQGQVKDQLKLEDILYSTMEQKFKGGALKQSKTARGLWSTITGVTKTALANILGMQADGTIKQGSLFEMLKEKMQIIVELLNKWQADGTIQRVGEQVTSAVEKMINFFTTLFEIVSKYRVLIETILVIVTGIYIAVKAFMILKTVLAVVNAVMMVLTGTMLTLPIGWIAAIIGIVVVALYTLWRNLDWVKLKFEEMFGPIDNIIKKFEKVAEAGKKAWAWMKKVVGYEDKEVEVDIKKEVQSSVKIENPELKMPDMPQGVERTGNEVISGVTTREYFGTNEMKAIFKGQENIKPYAPTVAQQNVTAQRQQPATGGSPAQNNSGKSIQVNIHGDVYGFNDFKEKVAEAVVKIFEQNSANVAVVR